MPGNKYYTHVAPKLEYIKQMARDGLIDKDIAYNLGVAESTFNGYKKIHPDLLESLTEGKQVADARVESALYRKALGFKETVKKAIKCKEVLYDNGKRISETEHIVYVDEEVYIPPDTTAQIFWLKNRRPDKWKDKQEVEVGGNLEVETNKLNSILDQLKKAKAD